MATKKFKNSQRFRVISGPACFYATKKEIESGVGDFVAFNLGVRIAMEVIEQSLNTDQPLAGVSGPYNNQPIQLNVA